VSVRSSQQLLAAICSNVDSASTSAASTNGGDNPPFEDVALPV
jgi:hypothetical protein